MREIAILLAALAVASALIWAFRHQRLRRIARERLNEDVVLAEERGEVTLAPYLRRHLWLPWAVGLAVALVGRFALNLDPVYAVALAVILGVVAHLVEAWLSARKRLLLESQLANSIDLMVASLGAGSGIMEAVAAAGGEAGEPLKSEFQEVLGRIRFGDTPKQVFEDLTRRVPLEAFRLFGFTMAVHGEVGGSLAPTLATVGRTIRDRIEIGRRVRAQSTQAQASVIGIVCITYFLALLMWRTNPENFEEFIAHPVGVNVVGIAIVLQAIGLLWIARLSQMRY